MVAGLLRRGMKPEVDRGVPPVGSRRARGGPERRVGVPGAEDWGAVGSGEPCEEKRPTEEPL